MADFVLVHGAFHGDWCWRHILPRLQALGHYVAAVNLPGHAPGEAPRPDVTHDDYRAAILDRLSPGCVLVGHSLGGLSITLAAAKRPDLIGKLVYLAAHVPPTSGRLGDIRAQTVTPELLRLSEQRDGLSRIKDHELADQVFYTQCSQEDRAFARAHLVPQPVSVFQEELQYDPPDVERHYIICAKDRAIRPEYQRGACADWPSRQVHQLNADHSPFFSNPDGLAAVLDAIGKA